MSRKVNVASTNLRKYLQKHFLATYPHHAQAYTLKIWSPSPSGRLNQEPDFDFDMLATDWGNY